jgi:CHAT domain-containing protein
VWKALVIGDPDGTLAAAREEAKAVAEVLADHKLKVDLRIGPPDVLGLGSEPDIEPADLFEVLELLQSGEYDIVHYAGHAFFKAEFPDRSGWAFKDDVLTASKLETVERPPQLVVANACISAAVSTRFASRVPTSTASESPSSAEGALVASLADEFFRRGVADYIGTAWEIPEVPAKQFAKSLYTTLFSEWKNGAAGPAQTLGAAVQKARQELHRQRASFGDHSSVWAAYQHYGDPTRTLADYR